jgi:DNA-binding transcriptional LysR family regulator
VGQRTGVDQHCIDLIDEGLVDALAHLAFMVPANLQSGALVRVLPGHSQRADVWAVTSARSTSSAKIRVCVDFLREHLTSGPFALITRGVDGDPV